MTDASPLSSAAEDEDRRREVLRLTETLRRLVGTFVATTAPVEVFGGVADDLEVLVDRLGAYPQDHLYTGFSEAAISGEHALDPTGGPFDHSPLMGLANPLAPPMRLRIEDSRVVGSVNCGLQYEGPPGCVHGGIVAAMFDELLGLAQSLSGRMGMTGRLIVNYRSPTPLATDLTLDAGLVSAEGRKVVVQGTIHSGDTLCAEAEGLFISIDPSRFSQMVADRDGVAPES